MVILFDLFSQPLGKEIIHMTLYRVASMTVLSATLTIAMLYFVAEVPKSGIRQILLFLAALWQSLYVLHALAAYKGKVVPTWSLVPLAVAPLPAVAIQFAVLTEVHFHFLRAGIMGVLILLALLIGPILVWIFSLMGLQWIRGKAWREI